MNLVLKNYLSRISGDSSLESSDFGTVVRIRFELVNGANRVASWQVKDKSLALSERDRFDKSLRLYSDLLDRLKNEELVIGLDSERYGLLLTEVIHRVWKASALRVPNSNNAVSLEWDIARRRGDRLGVVCCSTNDAP